MCMNVKRRTCESREIKGMRRVACVWLRGRVSVWAAQSQPALSAPITLATRPRRCVWTHTPDQRAVAREWGARRGRPPRPALGWQTCSLVVAANGALGPGLGPAAPAGRMVQRCSPRGRARRGRTSHPTVPHAVRRVCDDQLRVGSPAGVDARPTPAACVPYGGREEPEPGARPGAGALAAAPALGTVQDARAAKQRSRGCYRTQLPGW